MRYNKVRFKINIQGAPVVNDMVVVKRSKDIVVIEGDMKSKWCVYIGYVSGNYGNHNPSILIDATNRSLHLHPNKTGVTEIELVDFAGWSIWCVNVSRYSICACLIKETNERK
jgi:hypothetical protein